MVCRASLTHVSPTPRPPPAFLSAQLQGIKVPFLCLVTCLELRSFVEVCGSPVLSCCGIQQECRVCACLHVCAHMCMSVQACVPVCVHACVQVCS